MSELAIYTTDYNPRRLHPEDGDAVPTRVETAVRFGDAPLALSVTFEGDTTHLVWSFRGKRGSASNRTDYFVAAYRTDEPDPFRGFADALRGLHDEGWEIPAAGELRWNLGFELWRLPPGEVALDAAAVNTLLNRLEERPSHDEPMIVGMADYRDALALVRSIADAGLDRAVAVGTDGDPRGLDEVDLLLEPDADTNFVARSPGAPDVSAGGSTDAEVVPRRTRPSPELPDWDAEPRYVLLAGLAVTGACLLLAAVSLLDVLVDTELPGTFLHPRTAVGTAGGTVGATLVALLLGRSVFPPHRYGTIDSADSSAADGYDRLHRFLLGTPVGSRLPPTPTLATWLVTYGTAAGLAFPIVYRVGTGLLFEEALTYGLVESTTAAVVPVVGFAIGLFALSLTIVAGWRWLTGPRGAVIDLAELAAIGLAHTVYAAGLILTVMAASAVWYVVIAGVVAV